MISIAFRRINLMSRDFLDLFDQFQVQSHGLNKCIDFGKKLTNWNDTHDIIDWQTFFWWPISISPSTVPELGLTDLGLVDVLDHRLIPVEIQEYHLCI